MRQTLYDWCVENGKEYLLEEWDTARNLPLTPKDVSYGSSTRAVWWRCGKGHEWQASVYIRTSGSGCPICSGKRIVQGENDLATVCPDLVREWDVEKNAPLKPERISAYSHKMVWWRCEKGHSWRSVIKSRTYGTGCPVCAGRLLLPGVNDLATVYPELAAQWHPERNGRLRPTDILSGSHRKVWWRCEKGHEWQATINSRARVSGSGCPVCAGKAVLPGYNDLASQYPEIAAQWHESKNKPLTPKQVTPNSNRTVWWRCSLGHEYRAVVSARVTRDIGCPYCSGHRVLPGFNDLATLVPEVAAQWYEPLNAPLTPQMVTVGSRRKVWWQCSEGHVWKAVIGSRAGNQRCGCPVCAGKVKIRKKRRYYDR